MRKAFFIILFGIIFSCSSMAPASMTMTEPVDDSGILILGGLFVENMGIDEIYESIEDGIEVCLVGKCTINGKEEIRGYHVRTDENGYYFLENVPKGSYVIKGARIFIANSFSINVISQWRTTEISYFVPYLQEELIRHDVKFFPYPPPGRIYNFGITYFGLSRGSDQPGPRGAANSVLYQNFRSLVNQQINVGRTYNKVDPITYFKQKFPDSKWFKILQKEAL